MEGRIHHDCNDLSTRMDQILDDYCSSQEKDRFVEDIRRCPRCMDRFEKEKSFREFLQVKMVKKKVPARLESNIRNILREGRG